MPDLPRRHTDVSGMPGTGELAPTDEMPTRPILCVDDDDGARNALEAMLRRLGHTAVGVDSVRAAIQLLARTTVKLIITDLQMPHLGGMELLQMVLEQGLEVPVIMLTGYGTIEHAVAAIRAGAYDFITKPIHAAELGHAVSRTLTVARLRDENAALRAEVSAHRSANRVVGSSVATRRLLEHVRAAAASRATVLLQGESGTGKELLARAVHDQGDRAGGPFVRINCAAMPEGLIESTLFGHERGAFTGAFKRNIGAFERADGGTILLDEISEMRLDLQPKLLRVLQEREIERVGGSATIAVDTRVIATTNRDLAAEVNAGRFRQDLYYRLSVFPIVVPPLRDRAADIPELAQRFVARAAVEAGKRIDGLSADALALLKAHRWPGNVRELQHAIERAVILTREPVLQAHLFASLRAEAAGTMIHGVPDDVDALAGTSGHALYFPTLRLDQVEHAVIAHALHVAGGNRTRAAELLGLDVRTLRRRLNTGGSTSPDADAPGDNAARG